MNTILEQDIKEFTHSFALSEQLCNTSFLISGATGLIGSTLIHCLVALNQGIIIIAPVRNKQKANNLFDDYEKEYIQFVECDLLTYDYCQIGKVDYIVHCAAPTASKFFVEKPVETFEIIYEGTKVLLEYARNQPVKSFVYLSSLEVYGEINDDSISVKEDYQGYLDIMSVRSSYPMAKRAAENLCCLFGEEYKVPVKVVRLTQTTGPGIAKDDNRVIAQFTRLAAEGKNIVLHTTGESARPYCYTIDAISAILFVLLKGKTGQAYNVANEETYISAKNLAEKICALLNKDVSVLYEQNDNMGYAPSTKQRLSTKKIESLGWKAKYTLTDIITRLREFLYE